MNADDLLDYQLGQLAPARREQIEQEIASDPALNQRSARLALALVALTDDGLDDLQPPRDLTSRTLALVEQHRQRAGVLEFAPSRSPFRWSDVAVAAGIFLAGLATIVPALQRGRYAMQEATCTFNLQQLGKSLESYATAKGFYPQPPKQYPAGYFALQLKEGNPNFSLASLTCPGHGHGSSRVTADEPVLGGLDPQSADDARRFIANGYAYNAGYRQAAARYGPVPVDQARRVATPLLADLPPMDSQGRVLPDGNSRSHQHAGQNVLYSDQSVRFLRKRYLPGSRDDIYLNADRKPSLGLHESDVVLLPSSQPVEH